MAQCFTSLCSLASNSIICGLRTHKNVCLICFHFVNRKKNIIIKTKEVIDIWLLHPKIISQNMANQKSNASTSNYLLLNPIYVFCHSVHIILPVLSVNDLLESLEIHAYVISVVSSYLLFCWFLLNVFHFSKQ